MLILLVCTFLFIFVTYKFKGCDDKTPLMYINVSIKHNLFLYDRWYIGTINKAALSYEIFSFFFEKFFSSFLIKFYHRKIIHFQSNFLFFTHTYFKFLLMFDFWFFLNFWIIIFFRRSFIQIFCQDHRWVSIVNLSWRDFEVTPLLFKEGSGCESKTLVRDVSW